MNESKNNNANMYQTIPAVAALNRVPGFEPLKLLRKTRSRKTNEVVLKLALPYKKLWFRLANPKGRIRLNILKITEQIAIYEAQVYLDRSDAEPVSSFTACSAWKENENNDYIREAQEEAMDEALSLAGFGLQFADVGMTKEAERYGSEIPLAAVRPAPLQSPEREEELTLPVAPAAESGTAERKAAEVLPVQQTKAQQHEPKQHEPQRTVPQQTVPQQNQPQKVQNPVSEAHRAMEILQGKEADRGVEMEELPAAPAPEATPKYTRDTPVPEILKVMTFEEARNVVVDFGTCKGKTMQEVADTREASLKFYLFGGYKDGNNILLAAARIMYDHLQMKNAG